MAHSRQYAKDATTTSLSRIDTAESGLTLVRHLIWTTYMVWLVIGHPSTPWEYRCRNDGDKTDHKTAHHLVSKQQQGRVVNKPPSRQMPASELAGRLGELYLMLQCYLASSLKLEAHTGYVVAAVVWLRGVLCRNRSPLAGYDAVTVDLLLSLSSRLAASFSKSFAQEKRRTCLDRHLQKPT